MSSPIKCYHNVKCDTGLMTVKCQCELSTQQTTDLGTFLVYVLVPNEVGKTIKNEREIFFL